MLSGVGFAVLGPVAYAVQISLQRLMAPWYMPILSTVGVLLVLKSMKRRRTVGRVVALIAIVLLTGAEWGFLYALRLPAYIGPVAVGRPFPAFVARRADGTAFTQRDLAGEQNSALVFFRGRW